MRRKDGRGWSVGIGMNALFPVGLVLLLSLTARADRFDDRDKNGDGKLQKEELPPKARQNFERVDTDKDGSVSREEERAFFARRGPGVQSGLDGTFRVEKDVDYVGAGNPRQSLDLFLPKEKSEQPRPMIVFIHGGGWQNGSKEGGQRQLAELLATGKYAGASINYRLTNEARWPAQIHDCKAAIRWLKGHAEEYGIDPGKIAVWGTSAGGHLVAMLGVSGDVPELEGTLGKFTKENSKVACVVDFFGPTNLLTMSDFPSKMDHAAANSPEAKLIGGAIGETKEVAKNASPVTHVSKGDAPILIAHGTKDELVPYPQSVEFEKALLAVGVVPVVLIKMEDAGHGFRSEELDRQVAYFFGQELRGEKTHLSAAPIPAGM